MRKNANKCVAQPADVDMMGASTQQRRETQMKPNRNKPNDYRNWTRAALDAAIMYEIEN